jgi:hypothetical protein
MRKINKRQEAGADYHHRPRHTTNEKGENYPKTLVKI